MNYKWKLLLIVPLLLSFQGSQENLNSKWLKLNRDHQINPSEQSYCYISEDKPSGMNIHKRMKPASVSKLYTSFWALNKLGAKYRFETKFLIDQKTLYIKAGGDSFFVTENLFRVIEHLNKLNITSLNEIKFTPDFTLNWSKNTKTIANNLSEIFNISKWSSQTKQAFRDTNLYLSKKGLNPIEISDFKVSKVSSGLFDFPSYSFTHYSSELHSHLKQVNIYSNNFYSDQIFAFLGGEMAFEEFILRELNETKNDIYFYTGSGLGNNYTTCAITLKLLEKLEDEIQFQNLDLSELISVSGIDDGTLSSRFKSELNKDKVIAKTGTLRDTSTLAGFLGKERRRFVIFHHSFNASNAKKVQNLMVNEMIKDFSIDERLGYKKIDYISIDNTEIR